MVLEHVEFDMTRAKKYSKTMREMQAITPELTSANSGACQRKCAGIFSDSLAVVYKSPGTYLSAPGGGA